MISLLYWTLTCIACCTRITLLVIYMLSSATWLAFDRCTLLADSLSQTLVHFVSTIADDALLPLGISGRKTPTLPYHHAIAMESDEQSSILLTLICLSSVLIALIVSMFVRSDPSIDRKKNSWSAKL